MEGEGGCGVRSPLILDEERAGNRRTASTGKENWAHPFTSPAYLMTIDVPTKKMPLGRIWIQAMAYFGGEKLALLLDSGGGGVG